MANIDFMSMCKRTVADLYCEKGVHLSEDEVFIVWYCKTLKNYKAVLTTNQHDNMLYEVTYNGSEEEMYVDSYKKERNITVVMRPM